MRKRLRHARISKGAASKCAMKTSYATSAALVGKTLLAPGRRAVELPLYAAAFWGYTKLSANDGLFVELLDANDVRLADANPLSSGRGQIAPLDPIRRSHLGLLRFLVVESQPQRRRPAEDRGALGRFALHVAPRDRRHLCGRGGMARRRGAG